MEGNYCYAVRENGGGYLMNKHKPIKGPRSYTKKWFKVRSKSIGASEAAACCGMSRWGQPLSVYQSKSAPDESHKSKDEFIIGHLLESGILDGFQMKMGGTMQKGVPMLIHPVYPWMVATPDALWASRECKQSEIMSGDYFPVDAKTSRHSHEWGEENTDDIPQEYVFQAQQQMEVTGASECHIPVLLFGSGTIKIYRVNRSVHLMQHILSAEREMMERLENREPPEANWSHPGALQLMKDMYDVKEEAVELGVMGRNLWDELEVFRSQKNALEKKIEGNKARILEVMKDAAAGMLPDGRVIRRKKVNRASVTIPATSYVRMTCTKSNKESENAGNEH